MTSGDDDDWFFFDAAERELALAVLDAIGAQNPKQRAVVAAMLERLRRLARLIHESPSLAATWDGAGRSFSTESLIDQLCRVPDYDLDLHIPTKAVLGQAYLVAKINTLKAFGYNLNAVGAASELLARVDAEVAQSIYSKLAEELFIAIVTSPTTAQPVKMGAAKFLYDIWEQRLVIEVDDFAPLLESAWAARSRVRPVLGTMLGTHEVFRLFQEAQDKRFLDYFGEDDVEDEQLLAFEEFLFGLSHEQITRVRAHMSEAGRAIVSIDDARKLLGDTVPSWTPPSPNAAQALYTSYKKRRVNAAHRALTGASGPKKTAEEYVMTAFLERNQPA